MKPNLKHRATELRKHRALNLRVVQTMEVLVDSKQFQEILKPTSWWGKLWQ